MTLAPFREVTPPAIRLLVVMLPDQARAAGSRRCLLPSHYPLRFKSIVNYLQTAPLSLSSQRSGHQRVMQNFAWREGNSVLCSVKTVLPPLPTYLPISVPSLRPASHFAPRRHLVSSRNFHFSCRRQDTRRDTNVHVQFLTFCPSLTMKQVLNKRLPSWRG